MKKTLKTLLIASALTLPIAAYAGHHGHNEGKHQHEAAQHEKAIMGTGVIHSVSQMNSKINLTHAPIPALKWPEMTMDLDVAEGVDLKGLTSGQEITFHIKLGDDKVYRITKIMKMGAHGEHDAKQCMQGEDCPMHKGMKHPGNDGKMDDMKDMKHNKKDDNGDHKH
jgi:Cu(I)/Ag(I) efflux system periplasmic protein CusF